MSERGEKFRKEERGAEKRCSRYSPGIPSTYIAAGSPHAPLPLQQSCAYVYACTCPYIPRSYLGFSSCLSLSPSLPLSLSRRYTLAVAHPLSLSLTHRFAHARAQARLPTPIYALAADSVEWIARVTRTRVHRAAFRRVHAPTMKRWERKPRAWFAAAARHSASEPVRLAGNRPTNGRLSRASPSIDNADRFSPRNPRDCRQLRSRCRHTQPPPRRSRGSRSHTVFGHLVRKRRFSSPSRKLSRYTIGIDGSREFGKAGDFRRCVRRWQVYDAQLWR